MLKRVVIATRNAGKVREFRPLLEPVFERIISLAEFGQSPEVAEDGLTFRENALKKARAVAEFTRMPALADDSGLEVDALGGRPGVFSARYARLGASDGENIEKLLAEMTGAAERGARFVCCLALVMSDGREIVAEGTCEGLILTEPRGAGGFGYDPVFFLPEFNKTMAELIPDEKNRISHRGRAIEKLVERINTEFSKK